MRNIEYGKAVRKQRLKRGLKVFQLADHTGVDPVYITQIEKHGKLPSPAVAERISNALADKNLLTFYLEIKYPLLYEGRKKLYPDLNPVMEEIFKEMRRKNKTPEDQKDLEEKIIAFHDAFTKDKEELQRTIRLLELMEKVTLSFREKAEREGRLKEFRKHEKTVEKFYQGKA